MQISSAGPRYCLRWGKQRRHGASSQSPCFLGLCGPWNVNFQSVLAKFLLKSPPGGSILTIPTALGRCLGSVCVQRGRHQNPWAAAGLCSLQGNPKPAASIPFPLAMARKNRAGARIYIKVLTAGCYLCSAIMSVIETWCFFPRCTAALPCQHEHSRFLCFNLKHVIAYLLSWKSAAGVGN